METFWTMFAQADGGSGGGPGGQYGMLFMLVPMFLVMYFVMIRPQQKQQKEREAKISALKKNDHVLLQSGIYGIVKQASKEDKDVTVCIDERKDVCIRVTKAAIADLVKPAGTPEAEKAGDAKVEEPKKS